MQKETPPSLRHPKYWLTWLWTGVLRLLVRLPYRWQLKIGQAIGWALYHLARDRRHVTEVNLRLCFPEWTEEAHTQSVKEVFRHNGIGLLEAAMAWWAPANLFKQRYLLKGREHLEAALQQERGVILLGAHFSTLDLGGLLFSFEYPVDAMYRRNNNPVLEKVITQGRSRFFGQAIERSDIRSVIRNLKKNHIIWYAPDQDFGLHQSVMAPFFGVPAASITATTRMAKLNGSPILMLAQHRLNDGTYELELFPVLEDFPSGDEVADATRINAEIEKAIRKDPLQYMWMHRRFKSHPKGKNFLYQRTPSN
ncbi:LpxL/LpxP family Kdo(2)-lipid IV(A) lauroyl/palmitoleoyl acyltransferase [Nitrincola tapanii]|uniref:Lipid A biosynthesis acyltransferase n=1 Tax=Nitrincola tapanii TaxID=1708751 RepID=A0A5A9W0V9_9GAMM|nr:LpxL/LpxP family Kdo(2)-lipid IV(A) lauroyl/palmitoleoyl acyltransferase [Nitrincola tapanii]KAA0874357.1 LpxL/LpxP family Kdo(2)-lipid IV(A) lauroyl/palmitoleoyl acyltransferase [Nitrincola tapanii]